MKNNGAFREILNFWLASSVIMSKNLHYNFCFQINYIEKCIMLGDVFVLLVIDEEATSTNSLVLLRDGWVT